MDVYSSEMYYKADDPTNYQSVLSYNNTRAKQTVYVRILSLIVKRVPSGNSIRLFLFLFRTRFKPYTNPYGVHKLTFLWKSLYNLIDCPELSQNINFEVNRINFRNKCSFCLKDISTIYSRKFSYYILMSVGNDINYNNIYIFNAPLMEFIIKSLKLYRKLKIVKFLIIDCLFFFSFFIIRIFFFFF